MLETIRGDACTYIHLGSHAQLTIADYGAWQRMGETCDFIVMMGLHQEKRVDENTPFMICEMRKRLFELAYSHDKSIATFLGKLHPFFRCLSRRINSRKVAHQDSVIGTASYNSLPILMMQRCFWKVRN